MDGVTFQTSLTVLVSSYLILDVFDVPSLVKMKTQVEEWLQRDHPFAQRSLHIVGPELHEASFVSSSVFLMPSMET